MSDTSASTVVAVGDAVATVRVGDRVVVPPISMYGFGLAGGHWGGAIADRLAVAFADGMLVPLPEGVDPAAAASVADNIAHGYRHIGPFLPPLLARDPDARTLIVAGMTRHLISPSVPLYAGMVALALGGRHVTLVDDRAEVRTRANDLGLDAVDPAHARRLAPAPLVVDAGGSAAGIRLAIAKTAPDGICSSIGGLYKHARLPLSMMYGRNASLHVSRTHARTWIPPILELMVQGRLRPELVTTLVTLCGVSMTGPAPGRGPHGRPEHPHPRPVRALRRHRRPCQASRRRRLVHAQHGQRDVVGAGEPGQVVVDTCRGAGRIPWVRPAVVRVCLSGRR